MSQKSLSVVKVKVDWCLKKSIEDIISLSQYKNENGIKRNDLTLARQKRRNKDIISSDFGILNEKNEWDVYKWDQQNEHSNNFHIFILLLLR
jgi:hypothetical protein